MRTFSERRSLSALCGGKAAVITGAEQSMVISSTKSSKIKIGFHAPITGGLHNALLKSKELGCDTVQIFSRNPRGWMAKKLSTEDIRQFKAARRKTRISPVIIHAN